MGAALADGGRKAMKKALARCYKMSQLALYVLSSAALGWLAKDNMLVKAQSLLEMQF
jgi:hypothetical protein